MKAAPFIKYRITIILIVFMASCYQEQELPVKANFAIEFIDNQSTAPARIHIRNLTEGASSYAWSLGGGNPDTSNQKELGVIEYSTPGSYKIVLEASNKYGGRDSMSIPLIIDSAVSVGFLLTNTQSNYPPVSYTIANTSLGATTFEWTFEGGNPALSTLREPGNVVFEQPGPHKITLKVTNEKETKIKDTTIIVHPNLEADFTVSWLALDNDMQVPFTAILKNNSIGATMNSWSLTGGNPVTSNQVEPIVNYNNPGNYVITLSASNDKKTKTFSKNITLFPNTNLYSFNDVQLGINTAQNTIGCYFSSRLGRVIRANEVTAIDGAAIDFAFFGLNSAFTYNKFIPPDSVQQYTFTAIPNAIDGEVINRQDLCNCGLLYTPNDFDATVSGATLQSVNIIETTAGYTQFTNNMLPTIVLFKTQDGRKGAIKVKQLVSNGPDSYIICDIKVTK